MSGGSATVSNLVEVVLEEFQKRNNLPVSIYRLEFHRDNFTFRDAVSIVPYLAELGITHVHASPCLRIDSQASHGYAVVDHSQLNPDLGTDEDYHQFVKALHERGMAQILDIVPNHMAAAPGENRWWTDILENGQSSPFANYFDIEWEPVQETLENRILLPALGQQFGQALEAGEIQLGYEGGAFFFTVYHRKLPVDPKSYALILGRNIEVFQTEDFKEEHRRELESILSTIDHLPERTTLDEDFRQERQREKEVIKSRLHRLETESPEVEKWIARNLAELNGQPGDPSSFDLLEDLLKRQVYRLSHWKAASDEVNYRRFFDVNDLVAICTERLEVFEHSHQLVMDLLIQGDIQGLRIDHVDGLFDPRQYLWRLQWSYLRRLGREEWEQLSEGMDTPWEEIEKEFLLTIQSHVGGPSPIEILNLTPTPTRNPSKPEKSPDIAIRQPPYVFVEKILGPEEPLPLDWPVTGTSGYDFLNLVNGLFVNPEGFAKIRRMYGRYSGEEPEFERVVSQSKRLILESSMTSELSLLGHRLKHLAEKHRHSQDFTLNTLQRALRDVVACFSVYRTYAGPEGVSPRDQEVIQRAIKCAKRQNPLMEGKVFDFIRQILLGELHDDPDHPLRSYEFFVGRFQQVTSPVMAKGVEDTAFYRYVPLISVNEVGGHPPQASVSIEQFHAETENRLSHHPYAILTTSTHDTKRSEDVRARINVLSEIPDEWRSAVNRWSHLNRHFRSELDGEAAPSRNDEYLLYQTLVGTWPTASCSMAETERYIERIEWYMEKATHEAKLRTSWISPNAEYDEAVRQFVRAVLRHQPGNQFLEDFNSFYQQVLPAGLYTALSQLFLKLTSPGTPEIYQGQDLWDFSLVDPDNRRPVDYDFRRRVLEELETIALPDSEAADKLPAFSRMLAASPLDPRLKLFVTCQTLNFRKRNRDLFQAGRYLRLSAKGDLATHICAYVWKSKERGGMTAIVIAPRLLKTILSRAKEQNQQLPWDSGLWNQTDLFCSDIRSGQYQNLFTGRVCHIHDGKLALKDALTGFPLALLTLMAD